LSSSRDQHGGRFSLIQVTRVVGASSELPDEEDVQFDGPITVGNHLAPLVAVLIEPGNERTEISVDRNLVHLTLSQHEPDVGLRLEHLVHIRKDVENFGVRPPARGVAARCLGRDARRR
jgi:hypothetical protein